jgi:hypothetical protein
MVLYKFFGKKTLKIKKGREKSRQSCKLHPFDLWLKIQACTPGPRPEHQQSEKAKYSEY